MLPPAWRTSRFILPSSSEKIRRSVSLSAIQAICASPSPAVNPTSASSPGPMAPTVWPSTVTAADATRWTTTLTFGRLLDRYGLGEVAGLVHVDALPDR